MSLDLWKDSEPGRAEVENVKKRRWNRQVITNNN